MTAHAPHRRTAAPWHRAAGPRARKRLRGRASSDYLSCWRAQSSLAGAFRMAEERASVNALIEAHQRRLYGFMRVRVRDDATAEDLVQDTWGEVLRRADTFDPARGSFWTFTKIWADIVVKRHWQERIPEAVEREDDRESEPAAGASGGEDLSGADLAAGLPEGSNVDDRLHAARTLLDLLCRILACARPPHEIIVFGFSKLLWKPSEIVEDLADRRLLALAARLQEDYAASVPIPAVRAAFAPLLDKLERRLGDLIDDPRTRRANESLLSCVAGRDHARRLLSPRGRSRSAGDALVGFGQARGVQRDPPRRLRGGVRVAVRALPRGTAGRRGVAGA